jgi:hypothetical protein
MFLSCIGSVCLGIGGCVAPAESDPALAATDSAAAAAKADVAQPGAARPEVVKPIPVRPPLQAGATTGDASPPKPALRLAGPIVADLVWQVGISASPDSLWPTQHATITVTSNADVGPTPYYLRIRDGRTGAYLVTCNTGTSCSASVTSTQVDWGNFLGIIDDANHVEQATSDIFVGWHGADTALSASATKASVGSSVTLTATTDWDVGPSPFYIEIFDMTTGRFLSSCGGGTSCSVQVSQAEATTHAYEAFLAPFGTQLPLPGAIETTMMTFVTWATSSWTIGLTADFLTSSTATVTATASADVGPTPYYIEIFDENGTYNGIFVGLCGFGTTCTFQYQPSQHGSHLVAFVAPYTTSLTPVGAQANSVTVASWFIPPGVFP